VVEVLQLSLSDSFRMTTLEEKAGPPEGGRYAGGEGAQMVRLFLFWVGQGVGEVVGVVAVFDDDFHGALEAS